MRSRRNDGLGGVCRRRRQVNWYLEYGLRRRLYLTLVRSFRPLTQEGGEICQILLLIPLPQNTPAEWEFVIRVSREIQPMLKKIVSLILISCNSRKFK